MYKNPSDIPTEKVANIPTVELAKEWEAHLEFMSLARVTDLCLSCAVECDDEAPCTENRPTTSTMLPPPPVADIPIDYEPCGDCGFDHGYEQGEAAAWHREKRVNRSVSVTLLDC
jgi:hypothetical protein